MTKITTREILRHYGFLLLLLLIILGILIPVTFVANKFWAKGLKQSVSRVLNEEAESWYIGDNIEITSPMTTNAAAYSITNIDTKEEGVAVIIRITTLYGPQAVVYIMNEEGNVSFAGYSSLHGRIVNQIKNKPVTKQIEYWQNKIPEILER